MCFCNYCRHSDGLRSLGSETKTDTKFSTVFKTRTSRPYPLCPLFDNQQSVKRVKFKYRIKSIKLFCTYDYSHFLTYFSFRLSWLREFHDFYTRVNCRVNQRFVIIFTFFQKYLVYELMTSMPKFEVNTTTDALRHQIYKTRWKQIT